MTTLLGPDGRPLDVKRLMRDIEEPQTARIGSIRTEFENHPARGLTPAKLASLLQRAERGDLVGQAELAADMEERDAHLYAELGKRRGAITQLSWSIEEPDKATAQEVALTELVRDWVSLIVAQADGGLSGGPELVLQMMTAAILPGYAPIELVWQLRTDTRGRQVRVPACTLQPHTWFTASGDRRRLLLRSQTNTVPGTADGVPPVMGEELRPLAWLMHVHPARMGYVGRQSLARVLCWPYLFKNFAVRDLAEFLEIYGLPLRLGKYPAGAGDDEKRTLLQAVTAIGHNAAGIIPQNMALEFQAAAAGTEVPFVAMWDRMDAAESKALLGQTLTAGEGQHGTQALGKVHNEVRMDIRDADARAIERSFNAQIIAPLVLLNYPGADRVRAPQLKIDTGDADDMKAYADALPALVDVGLKIPVAWVHDKLRIPQPEGNEEVLAKATPPAPPPGTLPNPLDPKQPPQQPKPPVPPKQAALTGATGTSDPAPPHDLIDDLVAEQAAEWQALLGPMVEPLMAELDKALAAGETLETFGARLPDLIARLDAQPATTAIAQAAFSARLAGEAGVDL